MTPSELRVAAGRYRLSQAIYAAAELGIADHLQEGERSAEELASAVGADPDRLRRLLRALASEGVFTESGDGKFGLTDAGRLLTSGGGARDMILGWTLLPASYAAFGSLAEAVRTGGYAFEMANSLGFHEYLAAHPDASRAYDLANAETTEAFEMAAATYDFSGMETIVDVGGGTGGFLAAILRQTPGASGVLFDLPEVVAGLDPAAIGLDAKNRLTIIAGDFFRDRLPAADAYVLATVLRLFDDDRAADLLRNIRTAMKPGGRVLAMDFVHPEGPQVSPLGLADLQAMVVYGGRDRSVSEFSRLFASAGLRFVRVIDTGDPHQWVEASAAD